VDEPTRSALIALYRAVPSFASVEDEYWDETIDAGLSYPILENLSLYVRSRVESGDLSEVPQYLSETERILRAHDDSYVENLLVIAVIESLHHLPQVIPFLGPVSRYWWNELLVYVAGARLATDYEPPK
jgi:hypothetical protein